MHTFNVKIEPAMVQTAWNAWFFRTQRFGRLVFAGISLGAIVAWDTWEGGLSKWSIIALTVMAFTVLLLSGVYFFGLRRSQAKLASFDEGRATYTLTESRIETVSSLGNVSLAWAAIAELRRYQDLTFLRFRGVAAYSTIPSSQIPPEALQFLIERCRSAGAELIDI